MVTSKFGLGKGLGALLPSEEPQGVLELQVELIDFSPFQPRSAVNEKALEELAQSLKRSGVIQPIVVRRNKERFELIAGERRLRAARLAGFERIPAVIKEISDHDAAEFGLVENIQREDLNPIDIARAMKRLREDFGYTQDAIAEGVKKSRPYVANLLRLLDLPDQVQSAILESRITEGHGRTLLPLKDGVTILETMGKVVDEGLSVRQTEQLVKKLMTQTPKIKSKPIAEEERSEDIIQAESILRETLGTKVRVGRTKIEIDYFGKEDLDRICEVISK